MMSKPDQAKLQNKTGRTRPDAIEGSSGARSLRAGASLSAIKLPPPGSCQSSPAAAAYVLLNPGGGERFLTGSKFMVFWTGGLPDEKVNVYLIKIKPFVTVALIASDNPNDGKQQWTIPATFIKPTINPQMYQVYIENVSRTAWTYGPVFEIKKCASLKQPGSTTKKP